MSRRRNENRGVQPWTESRTVCHRQGINNNLLTYILIHLLSSVEIPPWNLGPDLESTLINPVQEDHRECGEVRRWWTFGSDRVPYPLLVGSKVPHWPSDTVPDREANIFFSLDFCRRETVDFKNWSNFRSWRQREKEETKVPTLGFTPFYCYTPDNSSTKDGRGTSVGSEVAICNRLKDYDYKRSGLISRKGWDVNHPQKWGTCSEDCITKTDMYRNKLSQTTVFLKRRCSSSAFKRDCNWLRPPSRWPPIFSINHHQVRTLRSST